MANTLYEIVSNALTDAKNGGKTPIGYTVKSYQGVLEHLQSQSQTTTTDTGVMGVRRVDFSGVANMTFDTNGMSEDPSSGIWKMQLNFTGSIPVQYQNAYDIVCFGYNLQNQLCGDTQMCPLKLSQDDYGRITVQDFKIGASFDLLGLGVQYFKKFFSKPDAAIDQGSVKKLFENDCLRAQLIFPHKNKYELVGIIGQTTIGKNACCYLTPPLLGAAGWNQCGIALKIKDSKGQHQLLPAGGQYTFPCFGGTYFPSKKTMAGMTKSAYNKWLQYSSNTYLQNPQRLELVKPPLQQCYVKLFVPKEKQSQARQFLPADINPNIFKPYQGVIIQGTRSSFEGPLRDRLESVCNKWQSVNVSTSNGGFWYSQAGRPSRLIRGVGGHYNSSHGSITALYGHQKSTGNFDCSSLPWMFLYDADIIRQDITSAPTFTTGTMHTAPSKLNPLLKPQYKAIQIQIDSTTQIYVGDIMWITGAQRKDSNSGHTAMAYPRGGQLWTLQIGDPSNSKVRPVGSLKNRPATYYKHLIRIVETNGQ